jgi:alpha-L-arabinofuranosidase
MRSTNGDAGWSQYTYSLKARKIAGAEGFFIMFHALDDRNFYWWNIGGWGNSRHAIEHAVNGAKSIVGNEAPGRVETGRWYDIRIEVDGSRIKCYLDGKLIHDVEDRGLPALTAIAGMDTRRSELVLKVVNTSDTSQETEINIDGAGRLSSDAVTTVLTSGSPLDENSLENPLKIAPVAGRVKGFVAQRRHTFPPNSLTILRFSRLRSSIELRQSRMRTPT